MFVFIWVYTYASVCIHLRLNHILQCQWEPLSAQVYWYLYGHAMKGKGRADSCVCVSAHAVCVDAHSVDVSLFLAPGVWRYMADVV